MSDHLPSDQISDDVRWVRRHLGGANPVPSPADLTPPRPGLVATLVATSAGDGALQREAPQLRTRRRAMVATALVGTAAMIAAIVAVGVIGRGGSGPSVTRVASAQPVFASASVTEAARTAQVSLSVTVGATVTNVQGVADLSTGNADFVADLPAPLGAVEVRTIGPVAYVQLPSSMQTLLGGKPWIKADVPTVEGLAGQQLGLPLAGGLDFTGLLDWVRGVAGGVTVVGADTIHGETATHYRANVDLTKAAANAPSAIRAKLEQTAMAAGQTIPVDVWIDNQGRVRQLRVSFDPSKFHSPASGTIKNPGTVVAIVDLWNFGTSVQVTPPPADHVNAVTGISGALRGLLGREGNPGAKGGLTTGTIPPG
jgi:hypothetical protein